MRIQDNNNPAPKQFVRMEEEIVSNFVTLFADNAESAAVDFEKIFEQSIGKRRFNCVLTNSDICSILREVIKYAQKKLEYDDD